MRQQHLFCLLVLYIIGYHAQDPTTTPPTEWNGDPRLCTVDSSPPSTSDRPLPSFPKIAEFTVELVKSKHIFDTTLPTELTIYQYLYDYEANKLVLITNDRGQTKVEYYYYEILKKAVYYRREICAVTEITKNFDIDGASAIQLDNVWHIRPLNEFLLFSSNDPRRPRIRPKFIGQSVVRGIPVDQWETCIINKTELRTTRRLWSFAQRGYTLPTGIVGESAVPIQAIINASYVFPNGTQAIEVDEVFNVHAYRPGIIENTEQLAPPKGVFCDSGPDQHLISLAEAGIEWPERFTVRVEASSSRSDQWQRFHLRYDHNQERGIRRVRYDYLPPGAADYRSVIHDYSDNLTYIIDRRTGSCEINRGVEYDDVSPLRDPIGFFIKHERRFIFRGHDKIWEFNGYRPCRGDMIRCASLTSSLDSFPAIVDVDTGKPSGEKWAATNFEYGWSVRAPYARPPSEINKHFDYPVYLFLRMYQFRDPANPSLDNIRTEDIEYEFYEMSQESNPGDFDTSICYRSLDYEYLHLGFTLKLSQGDSIDGNHLDRRLLERQIHTNLVYHMDIRYGRISDIQVDHERQANDVTVLFTLLGPTPAPESPTGVSNNEPTANQSRLLLERAIDDGKFEFQMKLIDGSGSTVRFQAVTSSLKGSKLIMSSHALGKRVIKETYSSGAEAGAVIGGILVGLFLGVLIAAFIRVARKEPMPDFLKMSPSFSNPLPSIKFHNKKTTDEANVTTDA